MEQTRDEELTAAEEYNRLSGLTKSLRSEMEETDALVGHARRVYEALMRQSSTAYARYMQHLVELTDLSSVRMVAFYAGHHEIATPYHYAERVRALRDERGLEHGPYEPDPRPVADAPVQGIASASPLTTTDPNWSQQ